MGVVYFMRAFLILCMAGATASAQNATVAGEVFVAGGEPLPYAAVSISSQGRQLLVNAAGRFVISVPAGEVRLGFKRIGFAPKDTVFRVTAGDTARIRIVMARLVIQLPEMLVSGKCTNETPREPMAGFFAELMDQVRQNAENMALLVAQKPFHVRTEHTNGLVDRSNKFMPTRVDTILRTDPLPERPYRPREVMFRITEGPYKGATGIRLPELADIADTAFTNNHCFRYAGRARVGSDSVIQIEFVPVPWLDKEFDLNGTLYLEVDSYQMVGSFTRLNRVPPGDLQEYFTDARFREIVPGVPVIDSWELVNRFRSDSRPRFVQRGRMIGIIWKDSIKTR
jgi:hypothetical protein